eukprot:TRINITY_DN5563_c0_g4_i1.p1 TRINITY_DN5563_c0_g4~~TRINITY_DN5563_c0_g4_i1.p1  ORF type:complete len:274 (+),score=45.84 TRINITY_DN5563_c0_g4_i1:93-914(+)
MGMKKVIPYIASNFHKDKIWLRKTNPSKRAYKILIAIDDSLSMKENQVGPMALHSMALLSLALEKLDVGQVGIGAIRDGLKLLHSFDKPLSTVDFPQILSEFTFEYSDKFSADISIPKFMDTAVKMFKSRKEEELGHQICFILSDGKLNKAAVRSFVREAKENGQLFVFIILDKKEEKDSITSIKTTKIVNEDGKTKVLLSNYLDDFPFEYYIIVKVYQILLVLIVSGHQSTSTDPCGHPPTISGDARSALGTFRRHCSLFDVFPMYLSLIHI